MARNTVRVAAFHGLHIEWPRRIEACCRVTAFMAGGGSGPVEAWRGRPATRLQEACNSSAGAGRIWVVGIVEVQPDNASSKQLRVERFGQVELEAPVYRCRVLPLDRSKALDRNHLDASTWKGSHRVAMPLLRYRIAKRDAVAVKFVREQ